MRVYEGLFLLDSGKSADWNAATSHVHGILTRYGATIIDSRKWDERRLAYEIRGHKRGSYMLVYFDAPRLNLAQVRRDLELSEMIIRYLIVVKEKFQPPKPGEPLTLPPGESPTDDLLGRIRSDEDDRGPRRGEEYDRPRRGPEGPESVPATEGEGESAGPEPKA